MLVMCDDIVKTRLGLINLLSQKLRAENSISKNSLFSFNASPVSAKLKQIAPESLALSFEAPLLRRNCLDANQPQKRQFTHGISCISFKGL